MPRLPDRCRCGSGTRSSSPTDNFALGVLYAADNGAEVVEGAVGGLDQHPLRPRASSSYADEQGVALTLVSSDINTANHNYPTNYNEAIYVAGLALRHGARTTPAPGPAACRARLT